jgi:hypothetical protein
MNIQVDTKNLSVDIILTFSSGSAQKKAAYFTIK